MASFFAAVRQDGGATTVSVRAPEILFLPRRGRGGIPAFMDLRHDVPLVDAILQFLEEDAEELRERASHSLNLKRSVLPVTMISSSAFPEIRITFAWRN